MIDLDYFKKINDNFGHLVGDKVLVEFAKLLRQSVRDYDIVCRYGGEEFLLVLPGSTLDNRRQLAERIREKTMQMTIYAEGEQVPISMSGGVARLENEDTVDSLLRRADDKLYEAKRRGRNRIV
ncbi:GGDEF domain-containing protein [Desulfurivibrio sp. D14AmB]|uniref:GGDEF domain-containing protein n=1 Tax=Desulfurivibrio sp. D14AmB TaxID=3374370 RepID=UPI00376F10C7